MCMLDKFSTYKNREERALVWFIAAVIIAAIIWGVDLLATLGRKELWRLEPLVARPDPKE